VVTPLLALIPKAVLLLPLARFCVVVSRAVSERVRTDGSVAVAKLIVKQRSSAKSGVEIARQVVE
jgi:hypothetical protein